MTVRTELCWYHRFDAKPYSIPSISSSSCCSRRCLSATRATLLAAKGGKKSICVKLPTLTRGRLIGPEGGPAGAETGQTSRVTASGAAAFMRRRHVSVICAGIKVFFLTSCNKSSGCLINPSTFSRPPETQRRG